MAVKVEMEIYYHRLHWETWFKQLLSSTDDAKKRMIQAIEKVMNDFGDVFSFGDGAQRIHSYGLIEEEIVLKERWIAALAQVLETAQITIPKLQVSKVKMGEMGNIQ